MCLSSSMHPDLANATSLKQTTDVTVMYKATCVVTRAYWTACKTTIMLCIMQHVLGLRDSHHSAKTTKAFLICHTAWAIELQRHQACIDYVAIAFDKLLVNRSWHDCLQAPCSNVSVIAWQKRIFYNRWCQMMPSSQRHSREWKSVPCKVLLVHVGVLDCWFDWWASSVMLTEDMSWGTDSYSLVSWLQLRSAFKCSFNHVPQGLTTLQLARCRPQVPCLGDAFASLRRG